MIFPPALFMALAARTQFTEFPEVVNITSVSPFFAYASTCRENTYVKSQSLAMHVMADASEHRHIAGSARRGLLYLPVSSSARCIASAAEPPLPQVSRVRPDLRVLR